MIGLTGDIGFEQLEGFVDGAVVAGCDAKTAALVDVELGEVEAEDMQHVVGHHEFAVIAQQIVGGARDGDPGGEQTLFELAQAVFAAAVGVRDERADAHAALHRGRQRAFDLIDVEAEDADVDGFLGFADRLHDGHHASIGLNDELHRDLVNLGYFLLFVAGCSFHSTSPLPLATSAVSALDTRSVCISNGAVTRYETSSSD